MINYWLPFDDSLVPSKSTEGHRRILDNQRSRIPFRRIQLIHFPTGRFGLVRIYFQQGRRDVRRQRYGEPVQRIRNSYPDRFDIRLLARPAIEEGLSPPIDRRRFQRFELIFREETLGD